MYIHLHVYIHIYVMYIYVHNINMYVYIGYALLLFRCSVMYDSVSDPMDCNPTGSSVHGISQARILERIVIPFSRGFSPPRD